MEWSYIAGITVQTTKSISLRRLLFLNEYRLTTFEATLQVRKYTQVHKLNHHGDHRLFHAEASFRLCTDF